MAQTIYLLCAVAAFICAVLLLRAYLRSRYRLLLWSGLCFVGLTLNNLILVLDKVVMVGSDLSVPRGFVAVVAMAVLLYGLVWDAE
jgi:Family of unknown function (DUF5985)